MQKPSPKENFILYSSQLKEEREFTLNYLYEHENLKLTRKQTKSKHKVAFCTLIFIKKKNGDDKKQILELDKGLQWTINIKEIEWKHMHKVAVPTFHVS